MFEDDPPNVGLQPPDSVLMRRIRRHRPEALRQLYDRYERLLKSLIVNVIHDEAEADDLLQESFMQIWEQARNYSSAKGKVLGWIITVARRRAIDRLRKREAYARAKERFAEGKRAVPRRRIDHGQDEFALADLRQFLRHRLRELPSFQQRAVELAFFNSMSHREIAAATGAPLGTVKTRLDLGLRKLAQSIGGLRGKVI
jgi:RNA polymerase sigma-70 factor (ECF subfamily)